MTEGVNDHDRYVKFCILSDDGARSFHGMIVRQSGAENRVRPGTTFFYIMQAQH